MLLVVVAPWPRTPHVRPGTRLRCCRRRPRIRSPQDTGRCLIVTLLLSGWSSERAVHSLPALRNAARGVQGRLPVDRQADRPAKRQPPGPDPQRPRGTSELVPLRGSAQGRPPAPASSGRHRLALGRAPRPHRKDDRWQVHRPRRPRRGGDGHRLRGAQPGHWPAGGHQGPSLGPASQEGRGSPLSPGGEGRRGHRASQHLRGLRPGNARRRVSVPRDGEARRRDPRGPHRARGRASHRGGRRHPHAGALRSGRRPREGNRPPRHQARERVSHAASWLPSGRQARRLRRIEDHRGPPRRHGRAGDGHDAHGDRPGHALLSRARAGARGPQPRRPGGPLRERRAAVRGTDGAQAVHRRQLQRSSHQHPHAQPPPSA